MFWEAQGEKKNIFDKKNENAKKKRILINARLKKFLLSEKNRIFINARF